MPVGSSEQYNRLLENNRRWVSEITELQPDFFEVLARGQKPPYLLIGCSDSRVPPDMLTQTMPGEIFITRNVANLVVNTDMNIMTVLQYAVEVLKVQHIIVMGHTECGGVRASMSNDSHGLIDKWLRNIKDVSRLHHKELSAIADPNKRFAKLVELNVVEQVYNLYKTSVVQHAWATGHHVQVHGWVCDIRTGLIHDLHVENRPEWNEISKLYEFNFPAHPNATEQERLHPVESMRNEMSARSGEHHHEH
ncbi:carbonate dehydratase [Capsaspora owczarzaki ATCC 30864]|nr:carbonate dehydratase [Capsaspora owczarzaki ATCC 30864]|eukprot:XP_004342925.1 carbonate dehydratase [Capsaspora owczarzaki ATCC 30864]